MRMRMRIRNTGGAGTLSFSLINWIIKAVLDDKSPRWLKRPMTLWLLLPLQFSKARDKPLAQPTSRRLWLCHWWFSRWKGLNYCSLLGRHSSPHRHLSQELKWCRRCRFNPPPTQLLNNAPVDFFIFWWVKSELAGLSLSKDTFKMSWNGVIRSIIKDEFTKHLFVVVWALWQVPPVWLQLRWENLENNYHFNSNIVFSLTIQVWFNLTT